MEDNEALYFYQDAQRSERAFLGAILLENKLMDLALEHLEPGSFLIPMNRAVFAAMVELHKKHQNLTPSSVLRELRLHGELPEAGGEVYVQSLRNSVPPSLTKKKIDYVNRFAIVAVGLAIQAAAFGEMDLEDIGKLINAKFNYLKKSIRESSAGKSLT